MEWLARFMGVNVETKACVYCGCDVQAEEAVASYVEFPDVDTYVTFNPYPPTMDDEIDSLTWWLHAWIPMREEYADVYALCLHCCEDVMMELHDPNYVPYDDPQTLWSMTVKKEDEDMR